MVTPAELGSIVAGFVFPLIVFVIAYEFFRKKKPNTEGEKEE